MTTKWQLQEIRALVDIVADETGAVSMTDPDEDSVGSWQHEEGKILDMTMTFGHVRRALSAIASLEAEEGPFIEIDGRRYQKFIRYPAEVIDGTLRCIRCGQIDEEPFHEQAACIEALSGNSSSGDREAAWSMKAGVLRSRGKNNSLHDIMQAADYLDEAAKLHTPPPQTHLPGSLTAPIDPSDAMIEAALAVDWECDGDEKAAAINIWHAMVAASQEAK